MSHKATNWAIQQRGLMPATKLVLWYLCDRHTPDFGCYPSQDQLAADAEISRASLNTHLRKLEEAGLIRRQRRAEQGTKQRKSTRYLLGFESDFPAKPCPNPQQSHVRILDMNLVRKKLLPRVTRTRAHTRGRPQKPPASQPAARGFALRQGR